MVYLIAGDNMNNESNENNDFINDRNKELRILKKETNQINQKILNSTEKMISILDKNKKENDSFENKKIIRFRNPNRITFIYAEIKKEELEKLRQMRQKEKIHKEKLSHKKIICRISELFSINKHKDVKENDENNFKEI
jgi:hypothetical protein